MGRKAGVGDFDKLTETKGERDRERNQTDDEEGGGGVLALLQE